jgi:cobalt-zinc-cadmium resistance protein CzcA
VGNVFEGENDMVIRLDQSNRRDINDLKNLCYNSNGEQIPLQELASIEYGRSIKFPERQHEQNWVGINENREETCKRRN